MPAIWSGVIALGIILALLFLAYNLSLLVPVTGTPGRDIETNTPTAPSDTFDKVWCKVDGKLEACAIPTSRYPLNCVGITDLVEYKICRGWWDVATSRDTIDLTD